MSGSYHSSPEQTRNQPHSLSRPSITGSEYTNSPIQAMETYPVTQSIRHHPALHIQTFNEPYYHSGYTTSVIPNHIENPRGVSRTQSLSISPRFNNQTQFLSGYQSHSQEETESNLERRTRNAHASQQSRRRRRLREEQVNAENHQLSQHNATKTAENAYLEQLIDQTKSDIALRQSMLSEFHNPIGTLPVPEHQDRLHIEHDMLKLERGILELQLIIDQLENQRRSPPRTP